MNKLFPLLVLSTIIISILSCKKETPSINPEIILPIESINISDAAGSKATVKFSTNTPWSITIDKIKSELDWLEISPLKGEAGEITLTVSVAKQNESYQERIACVKINAGSAAKQFEVIQKQKDAIILTNKNIEVPAIGEAFNVEIKRNIEYDIIIKDGNEWLSQTQSKALESNIITFNAKPNTTSNKREGKIIFKGKSSSISDTLILKQDMISEILYTSSSGKLIETYSKDGFDTEIIDNTYNDGIGKITFNGTITKIGLNTFKNCSDLSAITIPNSVIKIEGGAFENCIALTSVILHDDIISIGASAFSGCASLTSITIPKGLTTINAGTFSKCFRLASIIIPENVTTIGNMAFNECQKLKSVNIPIGVTTIGTGAFQNCYALTSISLPKDITTISWGTFSGCNALTSITIPDKVTTIGQDAFSNCSSISSITIPNSVTIISNNAFKGCSALNSVTLPINLKTIGGWAFYNCTSLLSVHCKSNTPPALDIAVFKYNHNDMKIYVPAESVSSYKNATNWSDYALIILPE